MTTVVTGGAGFLGSHVVDRLREDGGSPVVVRRSEYDLTDKTAVEELFAKEQPDVVFHLAAEVGGIGANSRHPGRYWYANLAMGINVLECCRQHSVEKVVIVGTVCSYPKFAQVPFREVDLWDGYPEETNAPYGIAKKSLIVGAMGYRAEYGLNCVCLLPANLYGPRDNFDERSSHVIPAMIRKMEAARNSQSSSVVLWGDGTATREFLYVDDCVDGLLLASARYNGVEPVNLGTGREIAIQELARLVAEACGFEGEIVWDRTKPSGQPRRSLDTSRAAEFGFTASTELCDGLARTVDWYRHGVGAPVTDDSVV